MGGMDENLREWSEWWLPGAAGDGAMGELQFDGSQGPRLTLFELPQGLDLGERRVPTLLGRTFDGTPLTLIDCALTAWKTTLVGRERARIDLRGSTLLRGAHCEDGDAISIGRARARYAGLRHLCFRVIRVDGEPSSFLAPEPGTQRRLLVDGGSLTFECVESREHSAFGESWECDVEVGIDADEPLTLSRFVERWLMPLQGLVILASREPTLETGLKLLLTGPGRADAAAVQAAPPGVFSREREVDVMQATPGLTAEPFFDYQHPLVPFAALGASIADFVAAWFRLYAELGEAALPLISALGSQLFLDNKLLNEMSFAESYHRLKHDSPAIARREHKAYVAAMLATVENEAHRDHYRQRLGYAAHQTARQRLEWLIGRAHDFLPDVPRLDLQLADDLVATRNALAHLDPASPPRLSGAALYYGIARLELVIQANILGDLGVAPAVVTSLIMNSYYRQFPIMVFPESEAT
jgi:hypothetical protein